MRCGAATGSGSLPPFPGVYVKTLVKEILPGDAEDCDHHDDIRLGNHVAYVGLTRVGLLPDKR